MQALGWPNARSVSMIHSRHKMGLVTTTLIVANCTNVIEGTMLLSLLLSCKTILYLYNRVEMILDAASKLGSSRDELEEENIDSDILSELGHDEEFVKIQPGQVGVRIHPQHDQIHVQFVICLGQDEQSSGKCQENWQNQVDQQPRTVLEVSQ